MYLIDSDELEYDHNCLKNLKYITSLYDYILVNL